MFRCSLFAIVVVGTQALGALAQDQPPLPKPGPEHAILKSSAGTWDATITSADGSKSKGVQVSTMECGGLWLVTDFKSEFGGAAFQGKGLDSYDAAKKKYVTVWVDSMATTPLHMEGTYDAASKTLTMIGDGPSEAGKPPTKFKNVSKFIDDKHHTFTMYMVAPDGKETKMMTIDYTRN